MDMGTEQLAHDFLAHRRFAFVGVSRSPDDFSRHLLRELLNRDYDVVPVNPALAEVEGRRCYRRVQEIAPPVEAALLMTAPLVSERVVLECAQAGIKLVWLHEGAGAGAASPLTLATCKAHHMATITGACPYMYLPNAGGLHRIHGFFRRHFGRWAA